MASSPNFPATVQTGRQQILPADTTTLKTLVTAGASGTRIDNIFVSSTDSSLKDLQFVITISGVDYILGTISVPINSGNIISVPSLGVFSSTQFAGLNTDVNGNKVLFLATGAVLKVKTTTTVTVAKVISIIAQCGDF